MDLVEPVEIPTSQVRFRLVFVVQSNLWSLWSPFLRTFDVSDGSTTPSRSGSKVRAIIVPAIALNKDKTERNNPKLGNSIELVPQNGSLNLFT